MYPDPKYSVLQVSIPQMISVKGRCETVRAQVRTSVQQRDDDSTFGGSPLGDLFFQQHMINIFQCVIIFVLRVGFKIKAICKVLYKD